MPRRSPASSRARAIEGGQTTTHPRLEEVVARHRKTAFQRPLAAHTVAAFEQLSEQLGQAGTRPLILDAGCGTGGSTRWLAREFPDCHVIGIDRSEARLRRGRAVACPTNAWLLRAELEDFWRLARRAGWRPVRQYLLYPNPNPKLSGLRRRWHGSPVFPTIVALGGRLELRTNWRIYADEFALALALHAVGCSVGQLPPGEPVTLFERKYAESGQPLWQLVAELSASVTDAG